MALGSDNVFPKLIVGGLTGSTAGMRVVGATASGAPTTGTHLVGDTVLSLADGKWYTCTVAGTPGTWVTPASGSSSAAELGYAASTTNQGSIGSSYTDLTGLSVTVTIGTRPVIVEVYLPLVSSSLAGSRLDLALVDVTASAVVQEAYSDPAGTSLGNHVYMRARVNPAAGTRTYKAQMLAETGTGSAYGSATAVKSIRVFEVQT